MLDVTVIISLILTFCYGVTTTIDPVLTLCCNVTVGARYRWGPSLSKFYVVTLPFGSCRDLTCVTCVSREATSQE